MRNGCRFSPHIEQITVLSRRKVRRAKLYYLRDRCDPVLLSIICCCMGAAQMW